MSRILRLPPNVVGTNRPADMSVYSTLLFIGVLPTAGATLFTVPAGDTCVVRDIEILNTTTSSSSPLLNAVVSGSVGTILSVPNLAANTHFQWQGRVVIPSGGTIAGVDAHGGQNCMISGYLLQ